MENLKIHAYGIFNSREKFRNAVEFRLLTGQNVLGEADIFEGAEFLETETGGIRIKDPGRIYPRISATSDPNGKITYTLTNPNDLTDQDVSGWTMVENP